MIPIASLKSLHSLVTDCSLPFPQLAAQRFVKYWEGRREVFGPEKFVMRMTLAEALRDDVVAIEAGMCCLLPQPDLHGRQVFYLEPRRHTREGYTSESMVRKQCLVWTLRFILCHSLISRTCRPFLRSFEQSGTFSKLP